MGTAEQPLDLLLLQERCRKDPVSYREEYESQQRHFEALLGSGKLQTSLGSRELIEVSQFLGAVSHCYEGNGESEFVSDIVTFLSEHGAVMDADLRRLVS